MVPDLASTEKMSRRFVLAYHEGEVHGKVKNTFICV